MESSTLPGSAQTSDKNQDAGFVDQLECMVPHMRAFARSLCRNEDLADDLVQDACLRAWAARDRFIAGTPMKPWLFTIIRNLHIQHWRRAWRSKSLDTSDAEKILTVPASQEWTCDFATMEKALVHLPEAQRDALLYVLVAGFSYEEAGSILGCSEGTVKSRVSRGRTALAGMLDSASGDDTDGASPPKMTGKAA